MAEHPTTAELDRLRTIEAAYTTLVHRAHDTNDDHLIIAIADANRTASTTTPSAPAEPAAVTREAAAVANQVTRAIYALKTPPPTGSEHYRSGWDTGLEAAADTARDAVLAATASQAAENERLRTMLDEYCCPACGGEGGGGTMDPDVWINCQTCRGTGLTGSRSAVLHEVIAGLEADRASHLAATRNPPYPEFVHTGSGIAGGLLTAVYRILARYEGHEAAHRHVAEILHAEKQAATDEARQAGQCGAELVPRVGTRPCVLPAGHDGTHHQDKHTNRWPIETQQADA